MIAVLVALAAGAAPVAAASVEERSVLAHERVLAGPALRGRGSATPDEAAAAAYVAKQFVAAGLKPAPGMTGYLQTARIARTELTRPARLLLDGTPIEGVTLLHGGVPKVAGRIASPGADGKSGPATVLAAPRAGDPLRPVFAAARAAGARLLILPESAATQKIVADRGRWVAEGLDGEAPARPERTVVSVSAAAMDRIEHAVGHDIAFDMPGTARQIVTTTNAVGYLPGRDPAADVLLLSAHLDHLGIRADGVIMPGANDDASGTVAIIELARALAAGGPRRRGILFVCYGAEEIGGYGSRYFAAHPPVPLTRIAANIEFEMIGAQDPKLPRGALMMTGYERSDLASMLTRHGALIAPDPYPAQNFFERSDNYQLALAGVVAHTLSGWAIPPTYHQPTDTIEHLDIPFMTRAIGSLVEPVRHLADSEDRPAWKPGGRPVQQ